MSGEEEETPVYPYTLVITEGDRAGEEIHRSRDFTGFGKVSWKEEDADLPDSYEGEFKEGVRSGYGKYVYPNGDVYEGGWENNVKHGNGTLTYSSKAPGAEEDAEEEEGAPKRGGVYTGGFVNGARHGDGSFEYSNGDVYSGQWADGKKHGKGHYIFKADGTSFRGEWANGQCVGGKWTHGDGKSVALKNRYGAPNGQACVTLPNGAQVLGTYTQTCEEAEEEPEEGQPKPDPKVVGVSFTSNSCVSVN